MTRSMNAILGDIVIASAGTVRNSDNRNMLLEDWLGAVSSEDVKNGDLITITGSGFGVAPNLIVPFDSVDNQTAYDGIAEGALMPTVDGGEPTAPYFATNPANPMKISYLNTYGGVGGYRGKVMVSTGDSYVDRPKGIDNELQGHTKILVIQKLWTDFGQFDAAYSDDKLFRVFDNDAGTFARVSVSNNDTYYVDNEGTDAGFRVSDTIRGRGPSSGWVEHETWVDLDNHKIRARHFNIDVASIDDPRIALSNPAATGMFLKAIGFDDGDDTTTGKSFRYAETYIADSRSKIVAHSAAEWSRSLICETQPDVTNWTDGSATASVMCLQLDPANHWRSVVIEQNGRLRAVATIKIGDPVEIRQDIARQVAGVADAAALYLKNPSSQDGNWINTGTSFQYRNWFLLMNASCTSIDFCYDGFANRIQYELASGNWLVRFGNGTAFTVASAQGGLDDSVTKRWLRVDVTATGWQLYLAPYVEDQAEGDIAWTLDASGTGTCNVSSCTQIGRTSGGVAGQIKAYIAEVQLTDLTTASNSKYWKLDEQVGNGSDCHIINYAQDENGVDDGNYFNVNETAQAYLPGEGY